MRCGLLPGRVEDVSYGTILFSWFNLFFMVLRSAIQQHTQGAVVGAAIHTYE
jgi:hypothetical protein